MRRSPEDAHCRMPRESRRTAAIPSHAARERADRASRCRGRSSARNRPPQRPQKVACFHLSPLRGPAPPNGATSRGTSRTPSRVHPSTTQHRGQRSARNADLVLPPVRGLGDSCPPPRPARGAATPRCSEGSVMLLLRRASCSDAEAGPLARSLTGPTPSLRPLLAARPPGGAASRGVVAPAPLNVAAAGSVDTGSHQSTGP